MDYKKAYKEALERAKQGKPIDEVFPELAGSEDERIRENLIDFLKSPFVNENITDEKVTPWIAWLEKKKVNPYSGVRFNYNGHTWGMCARDNGVEVLCDGIMIFSSYENQKSELKGENQ